MTDTSVDDDDDSPENFYDGVRETFYACLSNFEGTISEMPAKVFCGLYPSEYLRMVANFLTKVADEESKELADDEAGCDKARRAACAEAWKALGYDDATRH